MAQARDSSLTFIFLDYAFRHPQTLFLSTSTVDRGIPDP